MRQTRASEAIGQSLHLLREKLEKLNVCSKCQTGYLHLEEGSSHAFAISTFAPVLTELCDLIRR
jgi:hypothetical protein